jgi:23S rRNA maturation mini-RNase III
LNLDVRDFNWWTVKGRIENAKKRLVALGTARIAYHGDESYERQVRDLVDQIEILERPKMTDEEVLANWKARTNELRAAMRKMKGKN